MFYLRFTGSHEETMHFVPTTDHNCQMKDSMMAGTRTDAITGRNKRNSSSRILQNLYMTKIVGCTYKAAIWSRTNYLNVTT